MRSCLLLFLAVSSSALMPSLRAEGIRPDLGIPLNLSPLSDPALPGMSARRWILGLSFVDGITESRSDRRQQTVIAGSLYEIAYFQNFWNGKLSLKPRLRYREISYEYEQWSSLFDQLFRSSSTNEFWETYASTYVRWLLLPGLYLALEPEQVWVQQTYFSPFFRDNQQFTYSRQSWHLHWSQENWLLSWSYLVPLHIIGPSYQIRQPATLTFDFMWRGDEKRAWSLRISHRQNQRQDRRLKDSWLLAGGLEYRWADKWQWAFYGEWQPNYYHAEEHASVNNINSSALHLILEFLAYQDTNVSAGVRWHQAQETVSGKHIESQIQTIQIQFDHFLF
ncbi:MAG: hypothetical protein ACOH5I_07575 [Oligoflexus sp.]